MGNVNLVLIWVQKKDEHQINEAFQKTLAVRTLNPDARNLADMYFFETLVRIHRAGEGVAYTGLKPAETGVLHSHFVNEEVYAIPPLGLLPQLAAGKVTKEMAEVLKMTDKLKAELPAMLKEHQAIVRALDNLVIAAKREGRQEYIRFAEKLKLHAQTEEEVTYPTALLIGEYLKLRLSR